jgi:hypothetical protein
VFSHQFLFSLLFVSLSLECLLLQSCQSGVSLIRMIFVFLLLEFDSLFSLLLLLLPHLLLFSNNTYILLTATDIHPNLFSVLYTHTHTHTPTYTSMRNFELDVFLPALQRALKQNKRHVCVINDASSIISYLLLNIEKKTI